MTVSPVAGTPLGLHVAAVFQLPPAATLVLIAAYTFPPQMHNPDNNTDMAN
jgi:hypothetical protein